MNDIASEQGHCPVGMFYERDFARFRDHINKLQIFARKIHNRAERRQKFQKFSDNFTLHGFSYIFYRNSHEFERYIWAICLATAIIANIYVCSMLSTKYSDRTLITVVENSQHPVFSIDFPAVAICTKHRVNWIRFEQARRKFLPQNASKDTVEVFTQFVKHLDTLQFTTFENLAGLEGEPLQLIESLSVTQVAAYMAFRCEEVLHGNCMWAEQPFDCCSMFVQERTNMGICLVFNSIVSAESRQKAVNDKFYPYKNSKNGEGSGLVFTVTLSPSTLIPGEKTVDGIEMMIKKPDQWTDGKTYYLRANTNNGVMIKPDATTAHPDLLSYPLSFRKCLFQHEKGQRFSIPDLEYRQWNCRNQCHQDYVVRYCNCTIPLFFRTRGIQARECIPSDYICIYKNRDIFTHDKQPNVEKFVRQQGRGMTCPCPTSCDSLNYALTLNTVPIHNASDANNATTRVDIYYQSEVMLKYVTTLQFSTLDLTGYFGGIVTLFLGASIISSAEFFHFVILELVSYVEEKLEARRISRETNPKAT